MTEPICEVIISADDEDWLINFTRTLVEDRLAACGQHVVPIRSIYRWDGSVQDDREIRVALHTRAEYFGVNTGVAYVGSIGDSSDTEMTAMGDVVNVTARLASVAGAGELLVTAAAAAAAGLAGNLPRRSLQLKGKTQTTEVVVLT